jgi:hypothetical protein
MTNEEVEVREFAKNLLLLHVDWITVVNRVSDYKKDSMLNEASIRIVIDAEKELEAAGWDNQWSRTKERERRA